MGRLATGEWAHIAVWLALVLAAYATAGPYTFASCWIVLPLLMWPLKLILMLLAALSLIVLVTVPFRPRATGYVRASVHGTILTLGLAGCFFAAYASVGSVSCL